MAHQVLYRAYRPSTFKEVVGQDYIVKTLQNSIKNNNIAHAYLFAGPRGTGKTSIAKIFAKAINCLDSIDDACDNCDNCLSANNNTNPDIIEIDAASNNSVENIRDIIKNVSYMPVNGKYKVYIIDEVHMLSSSAFNAFLKTLEEPPSHVVFILATTDPNKVIPTVLSRCQRYNFSKIKNIDIKKRMIEVLNNENINYEEAALDIIASLADGGLRDALSLLEQYLAFNHQSVNLEDVEKLFSLTKTQDKINLLINTHTGKLDQAIVTLRMMYQNGIDLNRLAIELLEIVKETVLYANNFDEIMLNKLTKLEANDLIQNIKVIKLLEDTEYLESAITSFSSNKNMLSYLELALIKMAKDNNTSQVKTIKEETKPIVQKEVKEEIINKIEEPQKEVINEQPIPEEGISQEIDKSSVLDTLLEMLKIATKTEKINDEIILNRNVMYQYDTKYRKFYLLLNETEMIASCNAGIILATNKNTTANEINDPDTNKELIEFINQEYGINKYIYAVTTEQKQELFDRYRQLTEAEKQQTIEFKNPFINQEKKKSDVEEFFGGEILTIED